jgi:dolichyl-diphosphooligosaccharide---protein glycosyltransferase subunit DAD1/OST2
VALLSLAFQLLIIDCWNKPFNAFLSGFSAAVGQFVLTASLRMQTSSTDGGRDKKTGLSSSPPKGAAGQITQGISTER